MKKIFFCFYLLGSLCFAQTPPPKAPPTVLFPKDANGKIVYTEEVKQDGMTKDVIYSTINQWVLSSFKATSDSVIKNDKVSGIIQLKSRYNVTQVYFQKPQEAGTVRYTITISIKDNGYSYRIEGFFHDKGGELVSLGYVGRPYSEVKETGIYKEDFRDLQKQVDTKTLQLIKNLKEFVAKSAAKK